MCIVPALFHNKIFNPTLKQIFKQIFKKKKNLPATSSFRKIRTEAATGSAADNELGNGQLYEQAL